MTTEQFFPTRWVLNGVDRSTFASHLKRLRQTDRQLAKKCLNHAIYLDVLHVSPGRFENLYGRKLNLS